MLDKNEPVSTLITVRDLQINHDSVEQFSRRNIYTLEGAHRFIKVYFDELCRDHIEASVVPRHLITGPSGLSTRQEFDRIGYSLVVGITSSQEEIRSGLNIGWLKHAGSMSETGGMNNSFRPNHAQSSPFTFGRYQRFSTDLVFRLGTQTATISSLYDRILQRE